MRAVAGKGISLIWWDLLMHEAGKGPLACRRLSFDLLEFTHRIVAPIRCLVANQAICLNPILGFLLSSTSKSHVRVLRGFPSEASVVPPQRHAAAPRAKPASIPSAAKCACQAPRAFSGPT